jgi:tryptophan-rich sensory protein
MESKYKLSATWKFIISIFLCESVGITSGLLASANNNLWFDNLIKPSWNPPGYLFAPVWTTLYLLMGISLSLIWKNNASERSKRSAYVLFATQLFLNFWWSIFFFKMHSPALALVDIVLMVITIVLTIFSFSSFSKPAAWLFVPYISWVSFATILNFSIWNLNH